MTSNPMAQPSYSPISDDIQSIIRVDHIDELNELKKLVAFIHHLAQSIIHQIMGGMLSHSAARLKILQLHNLIQHCQLRQHPTIIQCLRQLTTLMTNTYPKEGERPLALPQKAITIRLSNAQIHHYVDSIRDFHTDPIYTMSEPSRKQAIQTMQNHQTNAATLANQQLSKPTATPSTKTSLPKPVPASNPSSQQPWLSPQSPIVAEPIPVPKRRFNRPLQSLSPAPTFTVHTTA